MTKDAGAEALGRITIPNLGTTAAESWHASMLPLSAASRGRLFHQTNCPRSRPAMLPSRCCAIPLLRNGVLAHCFAEPHQAGLRSIVAEPHLGPPPRRLRDGDPPRSRIAQRSFPHLDAAVTRIVDRGAVRNC